MNLYHLKYFQDAAAAGSVARAAAGNRVSPSAVSQAIRALERELGVELVRHARRRFELTEHGQRLAALGRDVFGAVARLKEDLSDPAAPPSGTLAFGISHSIATAFAGPLLARFSTDHPQVLLHLKTGPTEQLKELVRSGGAEFAVFVDDGDLRHLETSVVHAGRFVLVESRRGRRAGRPFLVTEPRADVEQFRAAHRRRFGREAGVFVRIESWEIIAHLAAAGLGVGFIPDYLLHGALRERLVVRDLGLAPVRYEMCVARARQRPLSRAARLLVEVFQKCTGVTR